MISEKIQKQYPELPLFLFGHSMGSFLARRYIQLYKNISGVILSGTGGSQGLIGKAGKLIAAIEARRIGRRTPSKLMNTLTFGDFNKAFQPARTAFDFLTRDEQAVDLYIRINTVVLFVQHNFIKIYYMVLKSFTALKK